MKKITLVLLFCLSIVSGFSQSQQWTLLSSKGSSFAEKDLTFRKHFPTKSEVYSLDYSTFEKSITDNSSRGSKIVQLPTGKGLQDFTIRESSALAPELSAKYPMIKSYIGQGTNDPSLTARFSMGTDGLHVVVYTAGSKTFYVDPYTKDNNNYIAYNREDLSKIQSDFECMVDEEVKTIQPSTNYSLRNADDEMLRTYRLAIACSGEYAQFHLTNQGVSSTATDVVKKAAVLSAMNTSMTRINGVYERDLGVTMEIVANNDQIIFLDAATDGITDGAAGTMINQVQTICDTQIGSANYDIGHVFSSAGSGLAGVGVVCVNGQKARGVTGIASAIGDPYDIDYVSHEMGHQFGATHTQNNACNRTASTAVEPGSASTIMGYAGICAPNVQNNSDDHFHAVSIDQMWSTIQSSASCAVLTDNGNSAPTSDAGADFSIPKSTPFVLRGVGTDADATNTLTYNWEQTDNEVATMPPLATNTSGPAFRSSPSTVSPNRYMPALPTVLAGNTSSTWEVVPSVARDMNFSLVVRDNNPGGGNSRRDDMVVSVVDVDPFVVSAPAAAVSWDVATSQTVTWNVGSTDTTPINSQLINIKLSIDGGLTFPIMLAENTANDGSESITVPNNVSTSARIMVEAADNIFYNVNAGNFTIVSSVPTFIITNTSGDINACNGAGNSAIYDLDLDFINGLSETVSFSTSGQPSGSVVTFSPATINADGSVEMTVSNLDGLTPQSYTITITGTSTSVTQTLDVVLNLQTGSFSTLSLLTPTNADTDVTILPTLTWSEDTSAASYDLELATDNAFANIIVSENTTTNSYTLVAPLNPVTTYYWRVKAKNSCAEGSFSSVFSFTTESPSYCAAAFTESADSEFISNVEFNTIDNTSGNDHDPTADDGYEDFTAISTNIKKDDTHTITVKFNTAGYQDHCYVFIDWNQDYVFNTTNERYDLGSHTEDRATATFDIVVPSDAVLGSTRMRVIIEYDDPNNDYGQGPCTADFITGWGETEDYTVVVEEATASIKDYAFSGFNLYPNPSNGDFNLNFDVVNTDKVSVQLFDIRGRLIGEKNFLDTKTKFSERISFNKAAAGLYLVKITNGNKQTTRKLVIE
jgi:hypothetical protein